MAVHTCTRCPLRFAARAEVVDHMALDHHVPAEGMDQLGYPAAHQVAPLYRSLHGDDGVHTVLLVANETLGPDVVARAMAGPRAAHPSVRAFVLVPATPSTHLATAPARGSGSEGSRSGRTDEAGLAHARYRLRTALDALRDLGVVAHGRVGDPNPLLAIAPVVGEEAVDEIILSTLAPGISRWLQMDLPTALERRFGVPVTTITRELSNPGGRTSAADR